MSRSPLPSWERARERGADRHFTLTPALSHRGRGSPVCGQSPLPLRERARERGAGRGFTLTPALSRQGRGSPVCGQSPLPLRERARERGAGRGFTLTPALSHQGRGSPFAVFGRFMGGFMRKAGLRHRAVHHLVGPHGRTPTRRKNSCRYSSGMSFFSPDRPSSTGLNASGTAPAAGGLRTVSR